MRIGCLTSSRADYGIYLPLLKKLEEDSFFDLEIIAFGTHLSPFHGYTLREIEKDGYTTIHKISSLLASDDEQSITTSYGLTVLKFASFWDQHQYDIVLCLGDRFEMSAAVQAGIPFGVTFAHLHGGETTLGAIDNIYRHQITLASKYHFTATDLFTEKVKQITGEDGNAYTVGSLSLDGITDMQFTDEKLFRETYTITKDFALLTFHPETVATDMNVKYADEMYAAMAQLCQVIYLVFTMPNADTQGTVYRDALLKLKSEFPDNVLLIENFGKKNYFSAMKYCKLLIGNTSSGIIEAASFGKYVINVGNRQLGRAQSANTIDCAFNSEDIVAKSKLALQRDTYTGDNIYYKQDAAQNLISILKQLS
jgi:GDP/UDP-N,N'-diacetylbacillosamine 2-epimerase (hydrolysing)